MKFLESKRAVSELVKLNQGNINFSDSNFKQKWVEKLALEGEDIELEDVNALRPDQLYPKEILDVQKEATEEDPIISNLNIFYNTNPRKIPVKMPSGLAVGHGALEEKDFNAYKVKTRDVEPGALIRTAALDETVAKSNTDGILDNVIVELPEELIESLGRGVVLGGLKQKNGDKYENIKPIVGDSLTVETEVGADYDSEEIFQALINAIASTHGKDSDKVVLLSFKAWTKLAGGRDVISLALLGQNGGTIGVGQISHYPHLNDTGVEIVVFNKKAYRLGMVQSSVEIRSAFDIHTNARLVEAIVDAYGSLSVYHGATVVKDASKK